MLNTLLMKILFLTVGDERHPSSQVRVYQFLPHFKQAWIICAVEPFLTIKTREKIAPLIASNNIFKIALAGAVIIAAVGKRFKIISSSGDYDAVVVQKDVLPFGLQGFLKRMNPNIIFEFDDAIWELPPDVKKRPAAMRLFYPYKIRLFHAILKKAGIILTNNSYQHNYAKKFNDKVAVITAPIDTGYFAPSDDPSTDKDAIVLGWVGTHGTTYMLESIAGALERIGRKFPYVKFLNIGGYPIGLNKIVVKNGVNGFLTRTEDEWIEKLSRLIEDRRLRQEMGANGRKIATEQYDIRDAARRYAELLYKTAEK